jgi:hypothetical protein
VLEAIRQARQKCDFLVVSIHWGTEYAPAPRPEDVETAHKMLDAGASVIVGHHPHVLQPVETYRTQDGRNTVIFYSLGNFLSNQSRTYVDGLMPDKDGDPRDEMIGLFLRCPQGLRPGRHARRTGPCGRSACLEREQPQRAGQRPREDAGDSSRFDRPRNSALAGPPRCVEQVEGRNVPDRCAKQEFIEVTNQLKLLDDRRKLIVARVGDEYITDPPKLAAKP